MTTREETQVEAMLRIQAEYEAAEAADTTRLPVAVEAGARAWFDRIQSQRMDEGRKRPDGLRWTWEDITEDDRVAYRAIVRPVVAAALEAVR